MKTERWICDTCNRPIAKASDGWIEWLTRHDAEDNSIRYGLRLVHAAPSSPLGMAKCQYDQEEIWKKEEAVLSDMGLDTFVGPDGLMDLLLLLQDGLPQGEVIEMIRRIHVPGYEDARPYFESAARAGAIEPNTPPGFYTQKEIRDTLDFANRHRAEAY